ncbi:MAG: AAA family ATPase, partial [Planctomycetales bacterium]|nr:AAA family ATPase [Planctomycetales bacterium]
KYPHQIQKLEQDFERRTVEIGEAYRVKRVALKEQAEREWSELAATWSTGLAEFQAGVEQMNEFCDHHFPPWQQNGTHEKRTPAGSIPAIRFGRFDFNLQALPGGLPTSKDLLVPKAEFEIPAILSYPQCPSLLLEAEGEGRDAATQVIQNMMLRLLTSLPPGKVRFTILDPVGLGQNFSAFMHLADFDERLVTNRIWTESNHINQRLTDLTEHMENVIQKYLRNEFASIQEYNEHAGEVAEPFQILVVANFPANFSDEAARRLVSIAASGARCGVYTLVSTDNKLTFPRNFDVADLERQAATLVWDVEQKRFAWKHDELKSLPLVLESPPGDEQFTEIIKAVGKLAKDAARVEVPFESVTPSEAELWNGDSRSEIEVPLGRAGATKLQYMRLGKGTSQHVLISGKTGSGKSTLLNALITNLALHYSPSELQFYLIDFKKGVEFKAYATAKLPHARVIAIESEREFGMSVLERLDQELKRRGDLFRKHGVQDLKGYRRAEPDAEMPRILLIIDEFQEFFTTDDRISHDSSLLLDRLVRQGRAFGIHLLLGSQTLAGAYSLARSTIGQMAVRIALQCSEADAHLILSEDNTAARLLSRPGEAIYNDANGLFEGNHPFQVVWLSDQLRESYLRKVAAMATERHLNLPPATVFEGNAAAEIADNHLLRAALAQPPQERLTPRAWLGAAVAIKDPTEVLFRRQGGTNLLIVGQ